MMTGAKHVLVTGAAAEFLRYLATPEVQCGPYFSAGGQPAAVDAWRDAECDRVTSAFFSRTIGAVEQAFLRNRFDGFPELQRSVAELVHSGLRFERQATDSAAAITALVYGAGRMLWVT